jgi:hypothetical protein
LPTRKAEIHDQQQAVISLKRSAAAFRAIAMAVSRN